MKKILISVLLLLFISSGVSAEGLNNLPFSLEEIPLFSGATRDKTAEEELKKQDEGWSDEVLDWIESEQTRIYTVKNTPEAVTRFYIEALNPVQWRTTFSDPPERGTVLEPWFEIEFFEEDSFENQYEGDILIYDGHWVYSCMSSTRPTWENGKWIRAVRLEWGRILENGNLLQCSVYIMDDSIDMYNRIFEEKTSITFNIIEEKSEESYLYDQDLEMEEEIEGLTEDYTNDPPTEEKLGLPLYPEAVFDAENSAGMSLDDYQCFIFLSDAAPDEVVSFYEEKLGREASPWGVGFIFPLKGELLMPEESITIEPNYMFGGSAQTVITIQKCIE